MGLKIGLTGGIGSGKSLICKVFNVLGIPVYDADSEAKRLMVTNTKLVAAIRSGFGNEAYLADGELNRTYLAEQVFNDESRLKQLNSLVHPVVIHEGEEWAHQQTAAYSIKEAALLFESGSYKLNDYTILVTAPEMLRISRVMQRDGVSMAQVERRMERQWSDKDKEEMADFVVVNDGVHPLLPQVLKLDGFFRSKQV